MIFSIVSSSANRLWAKGRSRETQRILTFSLLETCSLNCLTAREQTLVSRLGKALMIKVSPLKLANVFVDKSVADN